MFPQIYQKPKAGAKTIVEFSTCFENDTKTAFFVYQEDDVESSYCVLTDMFEPADTTGFELEALKNNLKLARQKVYELEQQIKNFLQRTSFKVGLRRAFVTPAVSDANLVINWGTSAKKVAVPTATRMNAEEQAYANMYNESE